MYSTVLYGCGTRLIVYDRANKMDSTVPWILTVASAPIMAFKQWVNFVQIYNASNWLAEGDREERKRQGLPKRKKNL